MAKVSPGRVLASEEINSASQRCGKDPNENILLPHPNQGGVLSSAVHNSQGDANSEIVPIELLLQQRQGTHTEVTIHQSHAKNLPKRLWCTDVFIYGEPCNMLTMIRLVQLIVVNFVTLILPWIIVVQDVAHQSPSWVWVMAALGFHSLLYVIEESTLYEFPSCRRNSQLCYAIFISILYACCEVYFGLVCSMTSNQYLTSFVLLIATVLYLADHWYGRTKATEQQASLESETTVTFDGVIRPEPKDEQLNVGPQLVFPIPKEFSMPGNLESS